MWVDVRIPYDENNQLAMAYNRALENSSAEWVLFLDHDVFLCNPKWYEMCLNAIDQLKDDPKAICVGCVCGGEHHKSSMGRGFVPTSNLDYHIKESKHHFKEFGNSLQIEKQHIAGYFMLLNRKNAMKIGFRQVKSSINKIDQDFGDRSLAAGYHNYMMRGLYIFHRRGMKHLKKEFVNEK